MIYWHSLSSPRRLLKNIFCLGISVSSSILSIRRFCCPLGGSPCLCGSALQGFQPWHILCLSSLAAAIALYHRAELGQHRKPSLWFSPLELHQEPCFHSLWHLFACLRSTPGDFHHSSASTHHALSGKSPVSQNQDSGDRASHLHLFTQSHWPLILLIPVQVSADGQGAVLWNNAPLRCKKQPGGMRGACVCLKPREDLWGHFFLSVQCNYF